MANQSAVEALEALLAESDGGDIPDSQIASFRRRTEAALRAAVGTDHPAVVQAHAVMWSSPVGGDEDGVFRRTGVAETRAIIEGVLLEVRALEPRGPRLGKTGFHAWVEGAVVGLWDSRHYRQAVDEAARSVELRLKAKLDKPDLAGAPLVTEAFNPDDPKPGEKRLRFPEFDPATRAWTNAHEGAMLFGRGCMMRIRNLIEHHDEEIEPRYALECLAALSLLARWADAAVVIEG